MVRPIQRVQSCVRRFCPCSWYFPYCKTLGPSFGEIQLFWMPSNNIYVSLLGPVFFDWFDNCIYTVAIKFNPKKQKRSLYCTRGFRALTGYFPQPTVWLQNASKSTDRGLFQGNFPLNYRIEFQLLYSPCVGTGSASYGIKNQVIESSDLFDLSIIQIAM